jgi:DNA polymerase elongation subunit (family B)
MELKWTNIDVATATKEEILQEIERLTNLKNVYMNEEQGIKIFINSCYGATGSPWFIFFNPDVAEAVTLQGQDLIKYSEKIINRYFSDFWHKDVKLHQKWGITDVKKLDLPVVIYIDTDSVDKDTKVRTDVGEMSIEDFYFLSKKKASNGEMLSGKEYTETPFKILNEVDGKIVFSPVNKVIRHKVSKPKWKMITKSGKEVIVTNDHSLIVLRDGKKVSIKPSEIKIGEKVICVKINNLKQ